MADDSQIRLNRGMPQYPAREPEIMHGFYVDHPELPPSAEKNATAEWNDLMKHAQCVPSDDPRLKEK
jgi:hypothetical protein